MLNYLKSYIAEEKRWLLIGTLPSIIWMMAAYFIKDYSQSFAVLIGMTLALVGYATLANNVYRYVSMKESDIPAGVLLFIGLASFFIVVYAFYYGIFKLVSPSANMSLRYMSGIDAIYFSTVTFTTLGYGDFLPNSSLGKSLVVTQTLLGTVHMVFFILVFMRNGQANAKR